MTVDCGHKGGSSDCRVTYFGFSSGDSDFGLWKSNRDVNDDVDACFAAGPLYCTLSTATVRPGKHNHTTTLTVNFGDYNHQASADT